jgi:hypothetical protein
MSEGPEVRLTADKICKGICRKTIDNVYCKLNLYAGYVYLIRDVVNIHRYQIKTDVHLDLLQLTDGFRSPMEIVALVLHSA